MSAVVKRYPALSLLVLAMVFGTAPILAVNAGLLPQGADQLGAFSASLAAIVLAALEGRKGGVKELLGRILIWRVGVRWWAVALFITVIPSIASLYLFQAFGGPAVDWSGLAPLPSVVPMIIMLTILAGVGEEFGWRGFALPRLQARHNALVSSLIVGVIWAIWHIPLFFTRGTTQNEWLMQAGPIVPIVGYGGFVIVNSMVFTWLFNNTRGSVLLAAVMHGAANAWVGGYIDVYRGEFGGVLAYGAVSVVVSLLVLLLAGSANLSRTNARNVLAIQGEPPRAGRLSVPASGTSEGV
jgi:membrane protease YdiL (CAAX protease family)